MKKIIFVVEDAILQNDGYKSRIEMEMDLLKEDFEFYMIVPSLDHKLTFRNSINIIPFDGYSSKYPFVFNRFKLRRTLISLLDQIPDAIVYCEALPSATIVYDICLERNVPYVYDCHGTAPDEVYLYHPNFAGKIFADWLRKKQNTIVETCDLLVTVSNKQYEVFKTTKPYVLLPMLPAQQFFYEQNSRDKTRAEIGIPKNAIVFCYAGQNQKWQMSEETIAYYKRIEESIPNAYLLVLTGSEKEFKELCLKNKISNFYVTKVPYVKMQDYLDAADYGFCLRQNHIINLVASPTKVLEYLSRNVMPILTPYVGDFSKQLKDQGLCVVLDNLNLLDFDKIPPINGNQFVIELSEGMKSAYIKELLRLGDSNG